MDGDDGSTGSDGGVDLAPQAIWTLRERTLMNMLRRCHAGESPDDVYIEAYVNLFEAAPDR